MAQPERTEQRHITAFLRQLGATVYTLGTTRKRDDVHHGTMQSAGLPDLLAFVPYPTFEKGHVDCLVMLEVKAPQGRVSAAQQVFAAHCAAAEVEHVIGGMDAVVDWALAHGCIEGDRAHFRIPRRRVLDVV